jgi:tRNA threonylcarbamoyladenosine biosynthesis protein TsaE
MNNAIFLANEEATLTCAARLSQCVKKHAIIFLKGDLGAGKTTFSRGFLRGLGYNGPVKSPTYTLVEPYEFPDFTLYHFDFYRLNSPQELEFIGIQDYLNPHAICLIEWPEKGEGLLPEPDLCCYISPDKEGRQLRIEAYSEKGKTILKRYQNEK